jgi:hypothetical protein
MNNDDPNKCIETDCATDDESTWGYVRELWQVEVYEDGAADVLQGWRTVGPGYTCEVEAGEYMHRLKTSAPLRQIRMVRYVPDEALIQNYARVETEQ